MTADLFDPGDLPDAPPADQRLGPQALLLRHFARVQAGTLWSAVTQTVRAAPWLHMQTPGGKSMSVATTSCGALGWISDRQGYRYTDRDPLTGLAWPAMPEPLLHLAQQAAQQAGFDGFTPDACLINRYAPGTRLSLHQDRDERDWQAPIVSVSLGLAATFLWGGQVRTDRAMRVPLEHGDVVVWGGQDRLRFHGVLPVKDGVHPLTGECRVNLTFRKAS
ncbi:MAG: DNA oxidative demethylase AlkB [Comamonadaceae bacterium]|nr:MAG: DNA oxidative demethylase AlkB [Comamonadaceae bacterium]